MCKELLELVLETNDDMDYVLGLSIELSDLILLKRCKYKSINTSVRIKGGIIVRSFYYQDREMIRVMNVNGVYGIYRVCDYIKEHELIKELED